jgi:hypothetical protein
MKGTYEPSNEVYNWHGNVYCIHFSGKMHHDHSKCGIHMLGS